MSLFKKIRKDLEGCSTPSQFAEPLKVREGVEVVSIPVGAAMRINHDFQETCDLIQAEEQQSLIAMEDIVAGGPVMQKKYTK